MFKYNKKYEYEISLSCWYGADSSDELSPSDFFLEKEWYAMDEKEQEDKFERACYEFMTSQYLSAGFKDNCYED